MVFSWILNALDFRIEISWALIFTRKTMNLHHEKPVKTA